MADRRRLLFVTGEYPPAVGGVGDYTRQLGRSLLARGYDVYVLTTGRIVAPEPGDPVALTLGHPWAWDTWRRVADLNTQLQPDVVHIQYQTGAFGMRPAIALLPRRLRRARPRPAIVVTAHDLRLPYLFPRADIARSWLTSRLFDDADAVIATNAEDADRLAGRGSRSREMFSPRRAIRRPLHTIPIGSNIAPCPPVAYDRGLWRRGLNVTDDQVLIAFFGLLSRTKGARELIEALAILPPRFRLIVIGGAAPQPDDQRYAAEIHALIRDRNVQDRVLITGPCAAPDVSAHLLAADLAALPFGDGASYRRGSLLATLSHGLPTITTPPAAPLDPPLLDGEHALLVGASVPEIRSAIERLAVDQALRARLRVGGQALARQFSWPAIAAGHENVYDSVKVSGVRFQVSGKIP